MTKTIWKYDVDVTEVPVTIAMPDKAEILTGIHSPNSQLVNFWAQVDNENPMVNRTFTVHGTGFDLADTIVQRHVGTSVVGGLVWHLYEITYPHPPALAGGSFRLKLGDGYIRTDIYETEAAAQAELTRLKRMYHRDRMPQTIADASVVWFGPGEIV